MSKLISVPRLSWGWRLTSSSFYLFWWVAVGDRTMQCCDDHWITKFSFWYPSAWIEYVMVRQTEDDKTDIVKCKITGNSSYNNSSAAVIARQSCLALLSVLCLSLILRNGFIQRFSYNCTQYSRTSLRRTGVLENLTALGFSNTPGSDCSVGSVRSSIASLGSDVKIIRL